jgi:hypothetical protein
MGYYCVLYLKLGVSMYQLMFFVGKENSMIGYLGKHKIIGPFILKKRGGKSIKWT